ncbi:MAG: oxalate/formate MFS antiporter [Chloroflexota bacterium]|nr:oxalate/formate MFS antiporter [Chloroflexota bacterium]MDE3192256.1 oxalate/formate MFS antiporter [Chloroflexota bacterium]
MSSATTAAPISEREDLLQNRWLILVAGIVCMIAIANYQYGWTLFVTPLQKALHANSAAPIQVAFSVFVLLETWLVPFEGWLVDKFGPRNLVLIGGILAGAGWYFSGSATTLTQLYLAYALSGVGAGIVYGTSVGNGLKWFPDRRGLAAGLTAMGFGAGAALTVLPIQSMISSAGYQATFQQWGIMQGIVVVIAALFLKAPPKGWLPRTWTLEAAANEVRKRQTALDFTPGEMAATKQFWILYVMMTLVATGGLMATAQIGPMAASFKVDKFPISFLWIQMTALTFALSANNVINGVCRPFWGWVSDHIGRERTMSLAFGLEGLAITLLILSLQLFKSPILFVVMSAFSFFGWAEIFSLFPATAGDFFGRKYATTNYGFLYTAKGTASVFVPIGSALAAGQAFDFRADVLLLIGALLIFFTMFLAPTALRLALSPTVRNALFVVAGVFLLYGLALTVVPTMWAPFALKPVAPNVGWGGVFAVAVVFDWCAAIFAFFILRRMAIPAAGTRPSVGREPAVAPAPAD